MGRRPLIILHWQQCSSPGTPKPLVWGSIPSGPASTCVGEFRIPLLGNQVKALPTMETVRLEVPVEGKDSREPTFLGKGHKRCIGQVHWEISVRLHQHFRAPDGCLRAFGNAKVTPSEHLPEGYLAGPAGRIAQEVHCLRENRPCGKKWR